METKYEPWYWLNDNSVKTLKAGYLLEGEEPLDRYKDIAQNAQDVLWGMYRDQHGYEKDDGYIPEEIMTFADKFYDYLSRGWFSLASPVLANFGRDRGLPVSCFNSHISDNCNSILFGLSEVGKMTQMGGGTSAYFGDLRPRGSSISKGGESEGVVHFLKMYESVANVMKQSSVRRGAIAVYLPIDHGDFDEFIEIRSDGNPLQDIFTGVVVDDWWMEEMIAGDKEKRKKWGKVIKARNNTGIPYIFFRDNANKNAPKVYKDKGRIINSGNLCNEICLSSTEDESFVCVLSSLNILHFDEWKDTDAPKILSMFLDAVNEEFINKAEDLPYMHRAVKFARNQRALGLGVLGWHSYLQANRIPFGSLNAISKTHEIFSFIEQSTDEINKQMSDWFGEPEILEGYGLRNTTTTAIAPTKSSSAILGGVSQGIEPIHSNYFIDSKAKTESVYKNPDLIEALNSYDKNTPEIWDSILDNGGSVQQLDFLTDNEKEVFRTFMEISQMDIIKQASERQKYIQQGQSLNLMIHPDMPVKDENSLYIEAWKSGVIGLYYRKSENSSVQFARNLVECSACGG